MKAAIPYIIIAVLLTLQISATFRKAPAKPTDEVIKAKDEMIKFVQDERVKDRVIYDSTIAVLLRADNQKVNEIKTIIYKYEKIPVTVAAYNNDELRRAVEQYR